MKLTDKQKQVIELMRQGGICSRYVRYTFHITSIAPFVILGQMQMKLSMPFIDGLIKLGVLTKSDKRGINPHMAEVFYELTELGKTIEL